ncbi:MAG: hypothetical protein R3B13_15135 [Polyangiaceae bacterium]
MTRPRPLPIALCLALAGCSITLGLDDLSSEPPPCAECSTLTPGSVGSGVVIPWDKLPRREVVAGFVQTGRLIVGIRVHGGLDEGVVMSVDLGDGRREIVAGWINDAYGAVHTPDTGPPLVDVRCVRPTAKGTWLAHLWQGFDFAGRLMEIEPSSGASTDLGPLGETCPSGPGAWSWPDLEDSTIAGQAVFASWDATDLSGVGHLAKGGCDFVPLPSEGPFLLHGEADAVWYADAKSGVVGSVDLAFKVKPLSAAAGDSAVRAITVSTTHVYLYRGESALEAVERTTGVRHSVTLPALQGGPPSESPHLFVESDSKLLLEADGRFFRLDPNSGATQLISY